MVKPQATNLHVGFTIAGTSALGFEGANIGATAGFDARLGRRLVLAVDASVLRVRKTVDGLGHQVEGREVLRIYAAPRFFVQGGAVESHYSVTAFSKSSVQGLVGAGYGSDHFTFAVNYRHDFTSENRARIVEVVATGYLKHHIFLRGSIAIDHFRAPNPQTGESLGVSIGTWF